MFRVFLEQGYMTVDQSYDNTTVSKLNKYLVNHWGLFKPKQRFVIYNPNDFDIEAYLDSWKTPYPGDFIEQQARKDNQPVINTDELLNFAIYALNNKSLSINKTDIEIFLYVLNNHITHALPITQTTERLLTKLLFDKYVVDYQLMLAYGLLRLLPTQTIYNISKHVIKKLTSLNVIRNYVNEPWTIDILTELVDIMNIPHNITSVIIKKVLKQTLYHCVNMFDKLHNRTLDRLRYFVNTHGQQIVCYELVKQRLFTY